MKTSDYLDATKQRLNIQSDYEMAKRFDVSNGAISEMRKGKRAVPLDVAYKIAITLELDPAQVVADLEAQREKNPKRQGFWQGFLSRAAMLLAVVACTLVWSFSATSGSVAGALGGALRRRRTYA
jgi:plasmid maintenance system antidote protein VapI